MNLPPIENKDDLIWLLVFARRSLNLERHKQNQLGGFTKKSLDDLEFLITKLEESAYKDND